MLVRIIDKNPVHYSLDNGISITEYEPGGIFEVPEFAGRNMIKRGWARALEPKDFEEVDGDPDTLLELRRPETTKESKP
jgi:hypothetical protein